MPLAAGTRLGPYEILAPLGAGGMGEVYRARDTKLDRDVAIKVLPSSLARDPAALARFEREAKAIAALSHPNILAVHDFGTSGETTYAVMELLEGESLRQRLAEGALTPRKASEIAREIALGLAAAHDKGIVHRDLKPENLFITKEGRVKILDFGLARQLGLPQAGDTHSPTATPGTEPGTVLGTVGYMAPEQLRGQPADHRSDIFSFGAVLYEMLAGRRAFLGETAIETMNAILKEDPPELSSSGKAIAPGFERIVSHCLEKKPDERFQSARDLAFDLGSLSNVTAATSASGTRQVRRGWPILAAIAAAAATLAVGLLAGRRLGTEASRDQALTFRRLTFRRGRVLSARFAPDGKTVAYAASWEGATPEIFTVRTDSAESRAIGLDHADVFAVSSLGELAVRIRQGTIATWPFEPGTLARIPIGGGTPRELLEDVTAADWAPNGEDLAVSRRLADGRSRLEFPIGSAVYDSLWGCEFIRVSPTADRVACAEPGDDSLESISTIDRHGKKVRVSGGWRSFAGMAWTPRGDGLYFIGGHTIGNSALRQVSLSGREHMLLSNAAGLWLHDAGSDGSLLVERRLGRNGMLCLRRGETRERELGWLDRSIARDISTDGSEVLFTEWGEGGGSRVGTYLRRTDGSPAIRLGDGTPGSLSSDGKRAASLLSGPTNQIVLYPVGPGRPDKVPVDGVNPAGAFLLANGKGIQVLASDGERVRMFVVAPEGGKAREIPTDGLDINHTTATSPDGGRLAYGSVDGKLKIAPIFEGSASAVPGLLLEKNDVIEQWSDDGRFLYVSRSDELPRPVDRVEIATGRRTPWKKLMPEDTSGLYWISQVSIAPDGQSYAYSYTAAVASALYVVEGLK
jgi:hypothetical protein